MTMRSLPLICALSLALGSPALAAEEPGANFVAKVLPEMPLAVAPQAASCQARWTVQPKVAPRAGARVSTAPSTATAPHALTRSQALALSSLTDSPRMVAATLTRPSSQVVVIAGRGGVGGWYGAEGWYGGA